MGNFSYLTSDQLNTEKQLRETDIKSHENQIASVQSQLNTNKTKLESLNTEYAALEKNIISGDITSSDIDRFNELGQQINDLEKNIEIGNQDLQNLKDDLQFEKDQLNDVNKEISERSGEYKTKKEETTEEKKETTEEKKVTDETKKEDITQKNNEEGSEDSNHLTAEFSNENYTDPKVVFDPVKSFANVVTPYISFSYNNEKTPEGMNASQNNTNDNLRLDGIQYPLVVINERNISNFDIEYMKMQFTDFLPELVITIHDEHQQEIKINTSQMSGSIRVVITSAVDKVYKKIKMNFRIYDMKVSPYDHRKVTYYGTYDLDSLRNVNTGLIYKDNYKATTWEMLWKIAKNTGLGFAATKETKNIEDRIYRNIFTQRYDQYIKQQMLYSGVDEDSIMDAWIDPYNYIILVNLSWLFSESPNHNELSIVSNIGFNGTSWDAPEAHPKKVPRLLTNFNQLNTDNNLFIQSYKISVNNNIVHRGTLERIYNISWQNNVTILETTDITTKQDSVDGEHIEDYETGSNRPIPVFNFNEDGHNLNSQKIIRQHFFRKIRQSVFRVTMEKVNLGLQRGTLVEVMIWEQDAVNKEIMISQPENLEGDQSFERKKMDYHSEPGPTDDEMVNQEGLQVANQKLSGLYYIDGIEYEYSKANRIIEQSLNLIKVGKTSGYNNYYSNPKYTPTKIQ